MSRPAAASAPTARPCSPTASRCSPTATPARWPPAATAPRWASSAPPRRRASSPAPPPPARPPATPSPSRSAPPQRSPPWRAWRRRPAASRPPTPPSTSRRRSTSPPSSPRTAPPGRPTGRPWRRWSGRRRLPVAEALVGIIGGSGFYRMEGLTDVRELRLDTPFGAPSSEIVLGTLEGVAVAFLPRHGPGHRILPGELPSRANVYALKTLGVETIVGVSAVGSLREDIEPLHLVVPDQLIDRTRGRPTTFFGEGLVAHIGFADPFCPELR